MDLTDKSQLIKYLKENGIWAKKGLSQNFLIDRSALDKVVGSAQIKTDELILEIGPGIGTLTEQLVKRAKLVVSTELDRTLAELLPVFFAKEYGAVSKQINLPQSVVDSTVEIKFPELKHTLNIVQTDILKINIPFIVGNQNYKVVANIPYAITSKIIRLFMTQQNKPEMMVLLVQKEVAERICAKPGEMSVLSLSVQLYGQPEIVDMVPKESFFPSPKVDSAILRIRIKNTELIIQNKEQEKELFRCINIGFSSKRKKLINNLSGGFQLDREIVSDIMRKEGLSENIRAQELTVEEWIRIAKAFKQVSN